MTENKSPRSLKSGNEAINIVKSKLKPKINELKEGLKSKVKPILLEVKPKINELKEGLKSKVKPILLEVKPKINELKEGLKSKVKPILLEVKPKFDQLKERIWKPQSHSQQKLVSTGQQVDLPDGLKLWEGSSAFVEQGRHWSSALIWLTSGLFFTALVWAFTARVDQTITVRGRLAPSGSVQEVDSPSAGVVNKVYVKDGDRVEAGQPLIDVEAKGLASRRNAIESSLSLLDLQARSLKVIIRSEGKPDKVGTLPPVPFVEDVELSEQLYTARNQTQQLISRLEQISSRLKSRQQSLRLHQRIAKDLGVLYREGGMARNDYLTRLDRVQSYEAEVSTLLEERTRVIGEAATQLNRVNRQIINLRSELIGLKEAISYRTIKAPISGTIFDAKVGPNSVVSTSDVLLKVVPADRLQANVEILNKDVGFVRVGLPVSVGVDSFSPGEFGYISGTLEKIGSDALEPSPLSQQYRFPAVISLEQQEVLYGEQKLNLQSGMGVSANIKLRSRPAISILTDMFTKQFEGIKRFR